MNLYFKEIKGKVPVAKNETKKSQFNSKIYTFSFNIIKICVNPTPCELMLFIGKFPQDDWTRLGKYHEGELLKLKIKLLVLPD